MIGPGIGISLGRVAAGGGLEAPAYLGTFTTHIVRWAAADDFDAAAHFSGDDITYSVSGEPTGVSINASTGLLSWTADAAIGAHSITVTATNGAGSDDGVLTLRIGIVADATFQIPTDVEGGNGNETVNLPSGMVEGDCVIIDGAVDSSTFTLVTAGYTAWYNPASTSPVPVSYFKFMGASPDASIQITRRVERIAGCIQVWRGVDPVTPLDNGAGTAATGTSNAPDCGSYTSVTNRALHQIVMYLDDDDASANVVAPSGWTVLTKADTGQGLTDQGGVTVAVASKVKATAGAEDPAAWSVAPSSDAWHAFHRALRPAA